MDREQLRETIRAAKETLQQGWEAFERDRIPDANPITRGLFRRTFYSGAAAGYLLTLAACAPEDEAEAEARLLILTEEVEQAIEEMGL